MDKFVSHFSAPKGLQYALERELVSLGLSVSKAYPGGVDASLNLRAVYKALAMSRIANRCIVQLSDTSVSSDEELYQAASDITWADHFSVSTKIAVEFSGKSDFVRKDLYGAMRVKDAIVDQFRNKVGRRPDVDRKDPQIRIYAKLRKNRLILGLDLSGESLHKRGYRLETGDAPLKENLAAGLLHLAKWPDIAAKGGSLVDPMCGSGTFLIEAMAIATQQPNVMTRKNWGFDHWLKHDAGLWQSVVDECTTNHEQALAQYNGRIIGYDIDGAVIAKSWRNIENAGFEKLIHVQSQSLTHFELSAASSNGLVITNPPYGERLGEKEKLKSVYRELGYLFSEHCTGWRAAVLTSDSDLSRYISWRSYKQYQVNNGALESLLVLFDLQLENQFKEAYGAYHERILDAKNWRVFHPERAQMLANRLKKNQKQLVKWASKKEISCYRLYDADMPEFALAIDLYFDVQGELWVHAQEYAAPKKVEAKHAFERLSEALCVLTETLSVDASHIFVKQRKVQRGQDQYEKNKQQGKFYAVRENMSELLVNFTDYLDTGLFLDHRPVRNQIHTLAAGKSFLNLFCYTASASVAAIRGGASSSLSLDMSNTYVDWAKRNFTQNDIDSEKHRIERKDCIEWLKQDQDIERFDLIFMDPPTFSNSKKMEGVLDIQRDHTSLIEACMSRLNQGGVLIFSTNLRRFKLDEELMARYEVKDVSQQTIDPDFKRNQSIHQCFEVRALNKRA